MQHVHLIGIGGSGLSAIAQVLLESGYLVSGSDRQISPLAQRLQDVGVQVFAGHRAENVLGADLVVRSSAIPENNVEVLAARQAGIPVLKRSEFLGQIMTGKTCIAVAGTHGKTTTTAMIAWMLTALGQDPSYIIGGVSTNLGGNAHAGKGAAFVIEADEYDRMFLGLQPKVAVVTNIEHDHPDCYPTPAEFYAVFREFARRIVPGGVLLCCGDDLGAERLLSEMRGQGLRTLAYGTTAGKLNFRAQNLKAGAHGGYMYDLVGLEPGKPAWAVPLALRVPGEHNVRNAAAALGVAACLGLPLGQAAAALGEFRGTGRRFELCGEAAGVTVIDDYAHHPTEVRATLSAARGRYPGRRILAVWQPHTYSRTRTLQAEFAAAFGEADRVLVMEVFPAREPQPADGYSAAQVAAAMQHPAASFVPTLEQARRLLSTELRSGDVLLVLSAGDADQLSRQVCQDLLEKEAGKQAPGEETRSAGGI